MSNDDKSSDRGGPIIAVVVVLLLLVGYVGAYFGLSEFAAAKGGNFRHFNESWQAEFFWPALMVEKRCRGELRVSWPVGGLYKSRRVE